MKTLSLSLPFLLLAGCSAAPEPGRVIASNNFEGLDGWSSVNYITKERAHQGIFAARVDEGNEFAANYTSALGHLSTEPLTKLGLKAWVYRSGREATAGLVVELEDPATHQRLSYTGIELAPLVKEPNKWTPIEHTIELPPTANPASVLKIYLWRTGQGAVYLDDFELRRL